MKNGNKHIEDLVEETLKAFDGNKRAKPKPFLFTRLQARMEREKSSVSKSVFLSPVIQGMALALVILVVSINIFTATRVFKSPVTTDSMATDETLFVEELYPSTPTLYNMNQTTINP